MRTSKKAIVVLCFTLVAAQAFPAVATDVPSTWAVDDVRAAVEAELVPLFLQDDFTRATTRAEFCALAVTLYENLRGEALEPQKAFADTDDVCVEKAAAAGLVYGTGGGLFSPDENLTREQAAALLVRISEAMTGDPLPKQPAGFADDGDISPWAAESVGQARAAGLMGDTGDNYFSPQSAYTVEQGIVTLYRIYDSMIIPEQDTPLAAFPPPEELTLQRIYELEVVDLVNLERSKLGLPPLEELDTLSQAAGIRAKEVSLKFSHNRPDGSLCFTVLKEFSIASRARSENIGGNFRSPQAIVEAWMNSEGHRDNIVNPIYSRQGVSLYIDPSGNYFWEQFLIGY